jgi:hypothetical protein
MEEKLKALLEYVKAEGRVCPMPDYWNQLWKMLPDKKRVGMGWEPPPPLILGAWWDTPLLAKTLRLDEHIHYAAEHGVLDRVDDYLRGLTAEQWFYGH